MVGKKTRLEIKNRVKITESDYRGILAFVLIVGLVASVLLGNFEASKIIGPLAGWAAGWYFGTKHTPT